VNKAVHEHDRQQVQVPTRDRICRPADQREPSCAIWNIELSHSRIVSESSSAATRVLIPHRRGRDFTLLWTGVSWGLCSRRSRRSCHRFDCEKELFFPSADHPISGRQSTVVICRCQCFSNASPVRPILERPRFVPCVREYSLRMWPTILACFLATVTGDPSGTFRTGPIQCFLSLFIEAVCVGLIDAHCSNRDAVSRRPHPSGGDKMQWRGRYHRQPARPDGASEPPRGPKPCLDIRENGFRCCPGCLSHLQWVSRRHRCLPPLPLPFVTCVENPL